MERVLTIIDDDSDYFIFEIVTPDCASPNALWVTGGGNRQLDPVHLSVDNLSRLIDYFTNIRSLLEEGKNDK